MAPTLSTPGTPASRVMELVRCLGMVKRDELARRTGLSPATVARAVSALIDAGLLRYGIDRVESRGAGRPGTPVSVDERRFAVLGIHLGHRATTVGLADLTGRVRASSFAPRRGGARLRAVGEQVTELLAAHPERQPLAAGIVAPWRELGWDRAAITARLHDLLGLDMAHAEHLDAMAAAEFLQETATAGITAFIYARETAGYVVVDHDGDRVTTSRHVSLNHFPTGSPAGCACGRTGCLIAAAGDEAIAQQAYAAGWVPQPRIDGVLRAAACGHRGAQGLLAERARLLADVAAHVADMVDPHRIVVAGQAYTADPQVRELLTKLVDLPVDVTRHGAAIQAHAACTVGLRPVDHAPLELAPRLARSTA